MELWHVIFSSLFFVVLFIHSPVSGLMCETCQGDEADNTRCWEGGRYPFKLCKRDQTVCSTTLVKSSVKGSHRFIHRTCNINQIGNKTQFCGLTNRVERPYAICIYVCRENGCNSVNANNLSWFGH